MIKNLFQSVGIVFTLLIIAAVAIVSMYMSYILGIGIVILTLIFITYHIVSTVRNHKSTTSTRTE
jgi:uncharacterized membrane protein YdfJ with MMPL/SSD domain